MSITKVVAMAKSQGQKSFLKIDKKPKENIECDEFIQGFNYKIK